MRSNQSGRRDKRPDQGAFAALWGRYYRFALKVGFEVLKVIKGIYDGERRLSAYLAARLTGPLQRLTGGTEALFRSMGRAVCRPFQLIARGCRLIHRNVSDARKIGFQFAVRAFFATLFGGMRRNSWFFKTLLNYAAPVAGLCVLIGVVQYCSGLTFAVAVECNGQSLGYIENEAVYEEAEKMLQQRIVYENEAERLETRPNFSLRIVEDGEVINEDHLVDRLIRMSDEDIVESNGIYIDGKFYGAVEDATAIEAAVEELLAPYRTGKPNETVELTRPVEIKQGLYLTASLTEPQGIVELLQSEVEGETTYTVQAGETPSGVAKKHGIAYEDFKAMNPGCEKRFMIGDKVYLSRSVPFMSVKVVRRETYQTETMYKTETTVDSKKSISYSKVTQKGVKGLNEITADIEYINGVETKRDIIGTKVLRETVNEKVVKGSKVSTTSGKVEASVGNGSLGNLKFRSPINGGRVTSRFGARRKTGRHTGIDIVIGRGTPTYASEDGIVVLSKWYSSYGNCVIIDHGNGWQTLYGHASKLLVKQGQQVKKGDVISLVGSTGRSSANHCHFEIRKNGTRVDPGPYIGR